MPHFNDRTNGGSGVYDDGFSTEKVGVTVDVAGGGGECHMSTVMLDSLIITIALQKRPLNRAIQADRAPASSQKTVAAPIALKVGGSIEAIAL